MEADRIEALASAIREYGESREPWQVQHEDAAASVRLERQLVWGLHLFGRIEAAEELVRGGNLPAPERDRLADTLDKAWEWWLAPCQLAEAAIRHLEHLQDDVELATRFREACKVARARVRSGARPGSWRASVQNPTGKLFGQAATTKNELRGNTGPFPE
jgi:hypothetical protein